MSVERRYAHHFESAKQEEEASKLGLWLFLCTEILMFGGLFVAYAIFHNIYPEVFLQGSKFLDWKLGSINTAVLLLSSFTMAMSIYSANTNRLKWSTLCLWITFFCGLIFMGVKYFEYSHKIHEGLLPGKYFSYQAEGMAGNLGLYFSLYYSMTGLHGSHVIVGMLCILWLIIRSHKREFGPGNILALECVGLFWHLVDLIWIYLFPLLYLVE